MFLIYIYIYGIIYDIYIYIHRIPSSPYICDSVYCAMTAAIYAISYRYIHILGTGIPIYIGYIYIIYIYIVKGWDCIMITCDIDREGDASIAYIVIYISHSRYYCLYLQYYDIYRYTYICCILYNIYTVD